MLIRAGSVTLVSEEEEEEDDDDQLVGRSYLVSRMCAQSGGPGWESIVVDGVAIP